MSETYAATVEITADCGDCTKTFKPGDTLDCVLPGTLESMLRLGQAVAVEAKKTKTTAAKPKGVE
jgi:hypothetical protein